MAAAWGIPAMRLGWDRVVGGNFKFADALFGATAVPPSGDTIAKALIGAFP